MKFTCDATTLKKGINIAQKAITGKTATPIMSGIYISANNNELILRGSDLNISIETKIPVKVEEKGEVLINAKIISDLIGKLSGEVSVYEEGQEVFFKYGENNISNTPKMNVDDYPAFPNLEIKNKIELTDNSFENLVYMTEFSCATDDTRPLFTGILLEVKDGKITFVGTNTHRLAIKSMNIQNEDLSCIIPSKVLNEIRNIALSYSDPQSVTIGLLYNQVLLSVADTKIVTRLLDGRFPDYRRVIPQTFTLNAKVNRQDLMTILDRVVIFSRTNDHSTVRMNFADNKLQIVASGVDVGSAKEEIPCEMDGNELKIAFNAAYIIDVLKHTNEEKITFKLNSALTPAMIDIGDNDYSYVITPIRVL
ncbi:MAG: DNA polymerase III subunit beta [Acidaminococcaceae bacterium]|nr:DNA polymerase III subunit beta [Acidaminococcaceae bacterium]